MAGPRARPFLFCQKAYAPDDVAAKGSDESGFFDDFQRVLQSIHFLIPIVFRSRVRGKLLFQCLKIRVYGTAIGKGRKEYRNAIL